MVREILSAEFQHFEFADSAGMTQADNQSQGHSALGFSQIWTRCCLFRTKMFIKYCRTQTLNVSQLNLIITTVITHHAQLKSSSSTPKGLQLVALGWPSKCRELSRCSVSESLVEGVWPMSSLIAGDEEIEVWPETIGTCQFKQFYPWCFLVSFHPGHFFCKDKDYVSNLQEHYCIGA